MPGISDCIDRLVEMGGGDLVVTPGRTPVIRRAGRMVPAGTEVVPAKEAGEVLVKAAPACVRERFRDGYRASFCADMAGKGRFLTHVFKERHGVAAVARHIPSEPPCLGELGVPEAARGLVRRPGGIVIVAGHAGSGKTTTLAAYVDLINRERPGRLVTIEDPTEFLHEPKLSVVHQFEAGAHFESFPEALRCAVREGADAALVGRVDDAETVTCAIEAAASGCTVLLEVCAQNSRDAVARLLSRFPAERRRDVAESLSSVLRGIVVQALVPSAEEGDNEPVPAFELFLATRASVAALAEKGADGVVAAIEAGARDGMRLLEESLVELAASGDVSTEDAAVRAPDAQDFRRRCDALGIHMEADRAPDGEKENERAGRRTTASIMTRRMSRAEMLLSAAEASETGRSSPRARSKMACFEATPVEAHAGARIRPELAAAGSAAWRVLLVDDDTYFLDLTTKMLEQAGAKVSAFANPAKALAQITDGRFDLAMFDVLMPDISGTELYDRALGVAPSLRERVFFVSAQASDDRLKARLTSRGCGLLRKPFSVEELMVALREATPVAGGGGR